MALAVRLRVAGALRRERSPQTVVADYTQTPAGVLAAGATLDAVGPLVRQVEAAGLRVESVEPALLALLRVICHADPEAVLVLRLGGEEAELVVGSGETVLVARRFPWSAAATESLVLEVDQTLRTVAGRDGAPRVGRVLLAGEGPWDRIAQALQARVGVSSQPASPHPAWGVGDVPQTHLAALGGLLPEPAQPPPRGIPRRYSLPQLKIRKGAR
jgi:Tfp pilus assembly PilM family ATPase